MDCKLFVYPVDDHGRVSKRPMIAPKQVLSVTDSGIDPRTGLKMRRVILTSEGAAINSRYTKDHVGEKVAIFCGSEEIVRPVIAAESSNEFVVLGP